MKLCIPKSLCRLSTGLLLALLALNLGATPLDDLLSSNHETGRLNLELIRAVYDNAVLESESIQRPVNILKSAAENTENSDSSRAKSYLSVAHLYWRFGAFDSATESVDLALELAESIDSYLLKARLLDAQGIEEGAVEWYAKALTATDVDEEREFIRIRLAMINVDETNVQALYDLALEQDQEFKNRAAITLAVLGHAEIALELYKPNEDDPKYFRQLIRYSEWALVAGDYETAQGYSWKAYDATELRFDGLYALTLVDEAYRKSDSLDELLLILERRTANQDNRDLVDFHIDLLTDMELYDDALALYSSLEQDSTDIAARQRLIQIYDMARRTDEMTLEYQHLIDEEPNIVQWYTGLASHYVSTAQPEKAGEVWKQLEANNPHDINVLVMGADYMSQMGFEQESIDMIQRHVEAHGPTTTGQIYLFETHYGKGRTELATQAIEDLFAALPPDAGDMRIVADGFERLQLFDRALEVFVNVEKYQEENLAYDDRMRLAWLHSRTGNKEDALRIWQEIWVSQNTPARRKFAESQFLLIAAELNKLADIALELENSLYNKTANKNDINLLVRIYTEIGDSFSAAETVEEYARYSGISEVERLKQLGLVYLQLEEYDKYDSVLRELEEVDPENRIEHIQNIVLNMVAYTVSEEADDKLEDIEHWLEQLRTFDEEAVTGEFEASVLSMSGFDEEAIESYRRAMVLHPTHSDNLLLMGELLKESNRTDEAVAIFQYVAEHSNDDNEFVVAIDGILNMIGQRRFGQRLPDEIQAIFRWTHRIILERITRKEDKFYLYTLLGEIANETLDTEGEFVAIENSVSQAGIRRLSVLRELVTMATQDAGFFSLEQKAGDSERQLTYGRRLIGLRQQLPPDVYISIAKTLLDQDFTLGAEKSLDLIQDITGQLDVNQTKADLFLDAGFVKRALSYYSHALSLNQDDSTLIIKTAMLRETNGQTEVANTLYLKGLLNILRSQPQKLHAEPSMGMDNVNPMMMMSMPYSFGGQRNTSVNRDYTTFYEPYVQGLISTWPTDATAEESILEAINELFQSEFASAQSLREEEDDLSITRLSRLKHLCQFIRRLSLSIDRKDISDAMDYALASEFISEELADQIAASLLMGTRDQDSEEISAVTVSTNFISHLQQQYELYGASLPSDVVSMIPPELQSETQDSGDVLVRGFNYAMQRRHIELISNLTALTTTPLTEEEIFQSFIDDGEFQFGLRFAKKFFQDNEYLRTVSGVVSQLKDDPAILFEMFIRNTDFIYEIEEEFGPFFETASELIDFLESPEAKQLLNQQFYNINSIWTYARNRDDIQFALELFEYVLSRPPPPNYPFSAMSYYLIDMHTYLLGLELDKNQRTQLSSISSELIGKFDFQDEYIIGSIIRLVLNLGAHPDNVDILKDMVAQVNQKIDLGVDGETLLEEFYNGNRSKAYDILVSADIDPNMQYMFNNITSQYFQQEEYQKTLAFMTGDCPSEEMVGQLMERSMSGFVNSVYGGEGEEVIDGLDILKRLVECFPENMELRYSLLTFVIQQNHTQEVSGQLKNVYELDKTSEPIRAAYFIWSNKRENYATSIAVTTDGGPDLRKPDVINDIFDRNDNSPFLYGAHPDAILRWIRDGGDSIGFRSLYTDSIPKGVKRAAAYLADLNDSNTDVEAREGLRRFWRSLNMQMLNPEPMYFMPGSPVELFLRWPADQSKLDELDFYGYRGGYRSGGVQSLVGYVQQQEWGEDPEEFASIMDEIVKRFDVGRDLETLLVSLPPYQRDNETDWYTLVVDAYVNHPESLAVRLNELNERLQSNSANDHEVNLWIYLTLAVDQEITPEMSEAFTNWASGTSLDNLRVILTIARIYSKIQDWETAGQYFSYLVASNFEIDQWSGRIRSNYGYGYEPMFEQLDELIDIVKEEFPIEHSQLFVRNILAMDPDFEKTEKTNYKTDAFVLDLLSQVYPESEVLAVAKEVRPSISHIIDFTKQNEPPEPYEAMPVVHVASILARSGEWEDALSYLKPLFVTIEVEVPEITDDMTEEELMALLSSTSGIAGNAAAMSVISSAVMSFSTATLMSPASMLNQTLSAGDLRGSPASSVLVFEMLDYLLDFDDPAWMNALTTTLTEWLYEDGMESRRISEMLGVIAFEYQNHEMTENALAITDTVTQWVAQKIDEIDQYSLSPYVKLAVKVDAPLSPTVVSKVIEHDLLEPSVLAKVLKSLRENSDPAVAYETVQSIAVATAGLSVLQELLEIGIAAEEESFAREVGELLQQNQEAFDSLELTVL